MINKILEPTPGIFPVRLIRESTTNPRKTFSGMEELTANVKRIGILQPVLLRTIPGQDLAEGEDPIVELVAGARRLRAAKAAGFAVIPGILHDLDDIEAVEIQLIENIQREDVNEYEEAESFLQLITDHKKTVEYIVETIGESRAYVYGRLKLLDLPKNIRASLIAAEVPASTALLVARIAIEKLQQKAADEIIHNNGTGEPMSVRAAAKHIRDHYTLNLVSAPFPTNDSTNFHVGSCTACPKRTGNARDLYPDAPADVCTDPECFAEKRNLFAAQKADEATMAARAKAAAAPLQSEDAAKTDGSSDKLDLPHLVPEANSNQEVTSKSDDVKRTTKATSSEAAATTIIEKGLTEALQLETKVRIEAYRKARAALPADFEMFGTAAAVLRAIAKCLVSDYMLPAKELSDLYPFNAMETEASLQYVEKAKTIELLPIILDVLVAPALTVTADDADKNGVPWPDGTGKVLWNEINAALNIDADVIRSELSPKPVKTAKKSVAMPKAKAPKDAPKEAFIVKATKKGAEKKSVVSAAKTKPALKKAKPPAKPLNPAAAWPFPTQSNNVSKAKEKAKVIKAEVATSWPFPVPKEGGEA